MRACPRRSFAWLIVITLFPLIIGGCLSTSASPSVRVLSVSRRDSLDYSTARHGWQYVRIRVAVSNRGGSTLSINPYQFKLETGEGVIYNYTGVSSSGALPRVQLVSGGSVDGMLTFEIPRDSSGLILIWEGSAFGPRIRVPIAR